MAIKIQNTKDVGNDGIKTIVFGKSGIGKTTLLGTAPRPIILSCESGLLSLKGQDIPYIEINTVHDIYEAYEYLVNGEGGEMYDTICLDSISEIAEVMLAELKKISKDPRQAYGTLADEMGELIRNFRDIKGKNVVFSAKQVRRTDDNTGITSYVASMPGQNLINAMPFFFDEVFYMTLMAAEDGAEYRVIKTEPQFDHDAKDRSNMLDAIEEPDLTKIFSKICGAKVSETTLPEKLEDVPEKDEEEETVYWRHAESDSTGTTTRTEFEEKYATECDEISEDEYNALQ